jgi:hypothetical protein
MVKKTRKTNKQSMKQRITKKYKIRTYGSPLEDSTGRMSCELM